MARRKDSWKITFFAPNKREAQKYLNRVKEREGYVFAPKNLRLAKKQIQSSGWKTWEATIPSKRR